MAKVTTKPVGKVFTLELSQEEADFVSSVLANCVDWRTGAGEMAEDLHGLLEAQGTNYCTFNCTYDETGEVFIVEEDA